MPYPEQSIELTGQGIQCNLNKWVHQRVFERYCHSAVWTGTKMIVLGGQYKDYIFEETLEYDLGLKTWTSKEPPSELTGTTLQSAIWTGSKMIVFGGYNRYSCTDKTWEYDPLTRQWCYIATDLNPENKQNHEMVYDSTRQCVILCGSTDTWEYFPR